MCVCVSVCVCVTHANWKLSVTWFGIDKSSANVFSFFYACTHARSFHFIWCNSKFWISHCKHSTKCTVLMIQRRVSHVNYRISHGCCFPFFRVHSFVRTVLCSVSFSNHTFYTLVLYPSILVFVCAYIIFPFYPFPPHNGKKRKSEKKIQK